MSDKKVSQLTTLATTEAEDLLLIVDDPNGTPTSKRITVKAFLGALSSNAVFQANATFQGNKVLIAANTTITKLATVNNMVLTIKSAPSTNNATTEGKAASTIWFSNTHLYIAVNATTIKRVALSVF